MAARYSVQPTLSLEPARAMFLLIEWNGETQGGQVEKFGRCIGEYGSLEAAIEGAHGMLLRQAGTALHRGA